MRYFIKFSILIAIAMYPFSHVVAEGIPKFAAYQTKPYNGKRASLQLTTPESRQFKTRLTEAYRTNINFAGQYIFVSWGAGKGCETGAILDVKTGKPYLLPFAACFPKDGINAFIYRRDSSLLVVSGKLTEASEAGTHFLVFKNGKLELVKTVVDGETIASKPTITIPDNVSITAMCGTKLHGAEIEEARDGRRIEVKPSRRSDDGRIEWNDLNSDGTLKVWCKLDQYLVDTKSEDLPIGTTDCVFHDGLMECFNRKASANTQKQNLLSQLFGGTTDDIEPSAGPTHAPPVSDTVGTLVVTEELKAQFSVLLTSLIGRWGYIKDNDEKVEIEDKIIASFANVVLKSSVAYDVTRNGQSFTLLYNPIADTFFLLKYNNGQVTSLGATAASTISKNAYSNEDAKRNFFENLLTHRPILVKSTVRDFSTFPDPERIFSYYLNDEEESILLQENLISSLQLFAWGSKEPCRAYAKSYLQRQEVTFGDVSVPKGTEFYTSAGMQIPQGRALAFADTKTNRKFGYIIFDKNDTTTCTPRAVLTSVF